MNREQIIDTIKRRRDEYWDNLYVNDPAYDITAAQAIVREYDALLIEIGAIKQEEALSA